MKLLAEKLYEARLARETVAVDFLPLFDHMLTRDHARRIWLSTKEPRS